MATRTDFTADDLRKVLEYIDGDNRSVLTTDSVTKFFILHDKLRGKMAADAAADQKKLFMLERRLAHYEKEEHENIEAGVFTESTRDSYAVALALQWCLQQLRTYKLTKSKFMLILYEAYATWLATKNERLFAEHPVATEWGPQFWRVYKRLNLATRIEYTAFEQLAQENSGVAAFIKNVAQKYYDWNESNLKKPILNSKPYKSATPEHNNGKWNMEINDSDIFVWRKNRK